MADNKRPSLGQRIGSYSAVDGRGASAFNAETGDGPANGEGRTWCPEAKGQPGGGSPGWDEIDKSRCQNPTPVSKRSLG